MISVVIPYNKNKTGLIYLLTVLQNQTILPHRIIIIDTSPDKSALVIVKTLHHNTCEIIVEQTGSISVYTAWNKGIEHAHGDHVFIINDDVIIPINILAALSFAASNTNALVYVPETSSRSHKSGTIDMEFLPTREGRITTTPVEWMPGFAFMLTSRAIEKVGIFNDEKFSVWFGDDDYQARINQWGKDNDTTAILQINNVFVFHFGGKSYNYSNSQTVAQIKKDRANYLKK
jgi:GT2 family glycosyltransferase